MIGCWHLMNRLFNRLDPLFKSLTCSSIGNSKCFFGESFHLAHHFEFILWKRLKATYDCKMTAFMTCDICFPTFISKHRQWSFTQTFFMAVDNLILRGLPVYSISWPGNIYWIRGHSHSINITRGASIYYIFNIFRHFWDTFGHLWTPVGHFWDTFGHLDILGHMGHFKTFLNLYGHFRTLSDTFGHFWTLMDTFGHFRTLSDTFGHLCTP